MEIVEAPEPSYWRLHGSHMPVTLPTPAAGAALTYTVPGSVQMDVVSISFLYTASANVATRIPFVEVLDSGGVAVFKVNTAYTITAGTASQVTFGPDVDQFGANNAASMGSSMPKVRLLDGLRISVSADAIDGSDTITQARMYVCQYDVVPDYS